MPKHLLNTKKSKEKNNKKDERERKEKQQVVRQQHVQQQLVQQQLVQNGDDYVEGRMRHICSGARGSMRQVINGARGLRRSGKQDLDCLMRPMNNGAGGSGIHDRELLNRKEKSGLSGILQKELVGGNECIDWLI